MPLLIITKMLLEEVVSDVYEMDLSNFICVFLFFFFFFPPPPQVSNIQARAVVLSWAPPVGLSCGPHSGLSFPYSYEVALSDKGRDGKYKIIYR